MRVRSRQFVPRQIVCKTTHPDEDVTEHLRYHVGPYSPSGPGNSGARGPLTDRLADAGAFGLRRSNK